MAQAQWKLVIHGGAGAMRPDHGDEDHEQRDGRDEQRRGGHHLARFRAPEQASIEYVVLDLDAVSKGIAVPEEELRKYYTENQARYTTPEERRAGHILVKHADRLIIGEPDGGVLVQRPEHQPLDGFRDLGT